MGTIWSVSPAGRARVPAAFKRRTPVRKAKRKPRPRTYGYDTLTPLIRVWRLAGMPSGKYLAATMGLWLPKLEAFGELKGVRFSPEVRAQLLTMSGATIDRMLRPTRAAMAPKGLSATKAGSELRSTIVVRRAAADRNTSRFRGSSRRTSSRTAARPWWVNSPARSPPPMCPPGGRRTSRSATAPTNGLSGRWRPGPDACRSRLSVWIPITAGSSSTTPWPAGDRPGDLLHPGEALQVQPRKPSAGGKTGTAIRHPYDKPRTPYQRVTAAGVLTPVKSAELQALFNTTNPADLTRRNHRHPDQTYRPRRRKDRRDGLARDPSKNT
jgi:hypothetical protein